MKTKNGNPIMASDPYRPISCAMHSELELAIMHKRRLDLRWTENGRRRTTRLQPLDLETREGNEYLLGEDATGQRRRIRLDRIESFALAERTDQSGSDG